MSDSRIMVIAFPDNSEESKRKMDAIMRIISNGNASVLPMEPDEEDANITFSFAGKRGLASLFG